MNHKKRLYINKTLALFLTLLIFICPGGISSCVWAAQTFASSESSCSDKTIYGFALKKTLHYEGHPVYEYKHEKSGMSVVVEKNNNIDKKFKISVKTPPQNDRGTNHVIEHCILGGSREYPCKNMLWELTKLAHATFINAITMPCYTTYPVSSIDEDELESLAKIYTSSVLHPLLLEDKKIFKKEGIRYELDENKNLKANGTVYNEMQKDSFLLNEGIKRIFPDTQGKNYYGGLPSEIMDLSYRELCETYRKYYHPSNMLITLTGDVNYERFFKWLDEEYLSYYTADNKCIAEYFSQNPENIEKYKKINIYQNKAEKNIIDIWASYVLTVDEYRSNRMELDTIATILNDKNSPRSKFLKDKGYTSVALETIDAFYEPLVVLNLCTDNADLASKESVEKILKELFNKYPITPEETERATKQKNFEESFKENIGTYDNDIDNNFFVMSFVKFGSPCSCEYFNIDENGNILDKNPDFFTQDDLMKTVNEIFSEEKQVITVFTPSQDERLSPAYKINQKLKSLEADKERLTKDYLEQNAWAESPNDSRNVEDLKRMFKKLSEVKTPSYSCPLEKGTLEGKECFKTEIGTSKFSYFKFVFKVNHLSESDRKYVNLLSHLFLNADTINHPRNEFEKLKSDKIKITPGFKIYEQNDTHEKSAFVIIDAIVKNSNLLESIEYLKEQINDVNYKDEKSIKNFSDQTLLYFRSMPTAVLKFQDLIFNHASAELRFLNANMSFEQKLEFWKSFSANFDNEVSKNKILDKLIELKNKILNRNSLVAVGLGGSSEQSEKLREYSRNFIASLSNEPIHESVPLNLGTPSDKKVAFVDSSRSNNGICQMLDIPELSSDIKFNITSQIVNNKYLIPNIREKGGAYGAYMSCEPSAGKVLIFSNFDPHVFESIRIFKSIPEFIKSVQLNQDEIENFAKTYLGSMFEKNLFDLANKQLEKAICQKIDYCGELNKNIKNIKTISIADIKKHGEILNNFMSRCSLFVISNKLNENEKSLFSEVISQ